METRTVRTIDLPDHGGWLVLERVARVDVNPYTTDDSPFGILLGWIVDITLTDGAVTRIGFGPKSALGVDLDEAKRRAHLWADELRYCIEHP